MSSDPPQWPVVSVEELIDRGTLSINDGYRAKNSELGNLGLPFARAKNVREGLSFQDADILSQSSVARAGSKVSEPDDVVFTSKGTVGRVAFVTPRTPRFVYSPQLCFWRVLDQNVLRPRFLYFWMHGAECSRQFYALKGQTDMADYISLRDQRSIEIPLPPVTQQARIVSILGTLDDKVDCNRRLGILLQQMMTALFSARFIEFIGVEDFEESEVGLIPQGWSTGMLSDLATVVMGQSPPSSSYSSDQGDGILLVQGKGGFGERYPTSMTWTSTPTKRVPPGTTLMTVRAPVGAVNVACSEVCVGRGVAGICSDYPCFAEFLVRSLEHRWAGEESGTIFPAVNRKQIENMSVVIPPTSAIEEYEETVASFVDSMLALYRETERLTELRDILLPRLISGEIRVPDASDPEEAIGAVAGETV
jgi:type I restriction enzyme S subunit